jgi:aminoglycoside phosphotransferase (APT) family kinase protein
MTPEVTAVLREACRIAGLNAAHAELIRAGENSLYRLPGQIVARVSRQGQVAAAEKEVRVSRWLAAHGVPVVAALPELSQPVEVEGRAVTFWRELPPHRRGTTAELAELLRQLHALPAPDFVLPPLEPFVRLKERISEAHWLPDDDRDWLLSLIAELETGYTTLPDGLPWCAIHGDAWSGNVAVTEHGPALLDLERFAFGPPEWDLTGVAVSYTTFGSVSAEEWQGFCARYGYDVTRWNGFPVFCDIRELRKVTFAVQLAEHREDIAEQARYRIACLRGERGPRPWGWTSVP